MISDQAYMLLALGVALGLGLMAIIHQVLAWDGQRRVANEMREQAAVRRAAIARAVASQSPPRPSGHRPDASRRRPAPPRWEPGPVAGEGRRARPGQPADPYQPRRARPASATGDLPVWNGGGQKTGPWPDFEAGVNQHQPPVRPYAPAGQPWH